ncbi:MAG: energy transducer TonB [Bacteroidetes bacterium]|nr:energy transducer TonB [Bacteroidota bacterium]NCQ12170.1 energy transducer TonB [Bacteroidota bacterium]
MLERKKPEADLRKSYTVYMQLGLVAALGILLILFKVDIRSESDIVLQTVEQETVKMEEIEQTRQDVKPPPPPRPPVPVAVPNDEVIEDDILDLDAEIDLDAPLELPPPPPPAEEEPDIFVVVEKRPEIKGGMKALYKYIVYPEIARKAGIEGRVILEFVVDERGKVSNVKVLRSVGGGLDEAAISAVKKVKFTPGMQRGRPVKVRYTLPVTFKLSS